MISTSQLDVFGYKVVFEGVSWKVAKGAMVVARVARSRKMYTIRNTAKLAKEGRNAENFIKSVDLSKVFIQ